MTNYHYGRHRRVYASRGDNHWFSPHSAYSAYSAYSKHNNKHTNKHHSGYNNTTTSTSTRRRRVPRFRNKSLYCGPGRIVDPAHLRPCAPHNTTSYLIAMKDQCASMDEHSAWIEHSLFGAPSYAMHSPSAPHELDDCFERS